MKSEARLQRLREGGISVDEFIDKFVYTYEAEEKAEEHAQAQGQMQRQQGHNSIAKPVGLSFSLKNYLRFHFN